MPRPDSGYRFLGLCHLAMMLSFVGTHSFECLGHLLVCSQALFRGSRLIGGNPLLRIDRLT